MSFIIRGGLGARTDTVDVAIERCDFLDKCTSNELHVLDTGSVGILGP